MKALLQGFILDGALLQNPKLSTTKMDTYNYQLDIFAPFFFFGVFFFFFGYDISKCESAT